MSGRVRCRELRIREDGCGEICHGLCVGVNKKKGWFWPVIYARARQGKHHGSMLFRVEGERASSFFAAAPACGATLSLLLSSVPSQLTRAPTVPAVAKAARRRTEKRMAGLGGGCRGCVCARERVRRVRRGASSQQPWREQTWATAAARARTLCPFRTASTPATSAKAPPRSGLRGGRGRPEAAGAAWETEERHAPVSVFL